MKPKRYAPLLWFLRKNENLRGKSGTFHPLSIKKLKNIEQLIFFCLFGQSRNFLPEFEEKLSFMPGFVYTYPM